MIRAYDEKYLDDAMKNLGEALDYSVCLCGLDMDVFLSMFVSSGLADSFGNGVPKYVSGMSGTELAMEVLKEVGYETDLPEPREEFLFTPEYWCGWILALFQWSSGNTFRQILEHINGPALMGMYPALHEAPEQKSIDVMDRMLERRTAGSRLQKAREARGLSQSELSRKAGVNLRTLQQYEIRAKNINRAAASTLLALSRTLGCRIDDLMETEEVSAEDL